MILDTRDFGGLIPRTDAKMLPANAAQVAQNVKLWNGVLAALKAPDLISTLTKTGTIQSIYRLPYLGSDYWLHWAADVDAARGPIEGDNIERLYYTGDYEPRVTHAEMAALKTDTVNGTDHYPSGYGEAVSTDYPRAFYALGIPKPLNAPTLGTPTGGSGTDEARAYVYTFVSARGEESAPSLPSAVDTGKPDGTWPLTALDTAPLNTGSISAATHSSGFVTVTTTVAHWLRANHRINIAAVVGMTDLNGDWTVFDVPSNTTFRIQLTTTQTYTSGGTWKRHAPYNVTNMMKRIYRVLSGVDGQDYKFVAEIAVATTTYNDTKVAADLGETLETQDPVIVGSAWDMPPGDMIGMIAMPGGFFAGFRKKQVCFSEPNAPYAWPLRYRQSTDWDVVGIGLWGATLVACTKAIPYRMTGYHPAAMGVSRGNEVYPCVAKRSVVSGSGFGVIYATDRGLAADNLQGTRLITRPFYDRDSWQSGVIAASMISMEYDGRYLGFWPVSSSIGGAIIFDPNDVEGAISTNTFMIDGTWYDPETGAGYVVDREGVKLWDGDEARRQIYEWRGKKHVLPLPMSFKAGKVICDFMQTPVEAAAIAAENVIMIAANAAIIASIPTSLSQVDPMFGTLAGNDIASFAIADDILAPLLSTEIEELQFELYGDDVLIHNVALTDNKPFRIPDGTKYTLVEKRMSGNVTVQSAQIAPTMSELAEA